MSRSKTKRIILIAAIVLQCVVLVYLIGAHDTIGRNALRNDNFGWGTFFFLQQCITAMLPIVVTLLLLILQLARPALLEKKSMTLLSCLLHCVTIGISMNLADAYDLYLYNHELWCACSAAMLSCALLLLNLLSNLWTYLVVGSIFTAWGPFVYFYGSNAPGLFVASLILVTGVLLLIWGLILHRRNRVPVKAASAALASEAPAPEPTLSSDSGSAPAAPAAPAPGALTCRHCGAKAEPDDIYCIECGNKL